MVGISYGANGILPGDGLSESTAYLIEDLADFDVFANQANAATYWASGVHTKLTCDPDLAGRPYITAIIAPDANSTNEDFDGIPFSGIFDGCGHIISNLTIDTVGADNDCLGLFGGIEGSSAEIKNLNIENINITGGPYSRSLGGLCGYNYEGRISNCYATGSVTGGDHSRYLGGLCGSNIGTISNCYATGSVTCVEYSYCLGGLCGWNRGTISNCYATGTVTGNSRLGGLCGANYGGTITECYATGSVTGGPASHNLGGLCGINLHGAITNCHSSGSVTGGDNSVSLGGLCGDNWDGTITNCFWDTETTGQTTSAGGWAMTTTQLKQETTYIGWNNGAWTINDGNDYPRLLWEGEPDPLITTDYPARTYFGDGISQPFEIVNAADLYCMSRRADDWGKVFVLKANIDMVAIGDYWPVTNFTGSFDGDGYTVNNLTIDATIIGNHSQLGLFGKISDGGDVRNVGLINVNVIGGDYSRSLGGLCGRNNDGEITNCYAAGLVTGRNDSRCLGGLCGKNYRGAITNCYATGSVNGGDGSSDLGGLCGKNEGTITNCFWDVETGGHDNGIGTPKTTTEMQTESTFTDANWDFTVVPLWHMPFQAVGYPMLGWQKDIPGDFTGRYGVYMDDFAILSNAWLSDNTPTANWNEHCDLNGNGVINPGDLKIFAEHWLCN